MKRKPPLITLTLTVLAALLGALSGPIGNAVELPSLLKPFAIPLFLGLAFVLSLIALSQYFLQQEQTEAPPSPLTEQNRQRLLARVRQFWITGVLDQSMHGAAIIALGLQNQPDVLANPWRLVLQEQNQSARALPASTRITQVYDEALEHLLILGEPGCGKTTLLLELARDLLGRAEQDESLPVPMVFPLSSWAVKRQPLTEWLVEEMNTKYQVPRRLAQAWMSAGQILPLLDGLDEVAAPHRDACVACINTFRQEHGLVPMVVCSRSADYLALKQRLLLDCAVVVQPLTAQQIDEYLSGVSEQMEGVRVALKNDSVLREMATTPLLLSVITLAYHEVAAKNVAASDSLEVRRRRLFDDYVTAMLQRRSSETRFTTQQTVSWLAWLARQMMQHNRTEFFLERLQPEWLSDTRSRVVYHVVAGLLAGLVFGLVVGLVGGLVGGLAVGLVVGLLFGGYAFLQHFILRWFLWRTGRMPWNYARFLDYATERIFLRKVGGGYTFVHRLLLKYFATRTDNIASRKKETSARL